MTRVRRIVGATRARCARVGVRIALVGLAAVVAIAASGAVHPASATTVFALVDTGELFASGDGGATWTIRATLPTSDAVAIAAGETTDELFLMTRSGSVYRSIDAGVNWSGVGTIAASDIVGMAIDPAGDILALSESGSVWRSTDDGATFTGIAALTLGANCAAIALDPPSGDVFAIARTGEVVRSIDAGATFDPVGVVTTPDIAALLVRSGSLYALTGAGAVAQSDDDGASWVFVGTFSQVHATALTTDGTGIVAATAEGLVAASTDATSWTWVGTINQLDVVALGNDIPTVTAVGPSRAPAAGLRIAALYPNPGGRGDAVTLDITLDHAEAVSLELYDVAGHLVARRAAEPMGEGFGRIDWTPPHRAAGVYFLRARTTSGLTARVRMVRVD